MGTERCVPPGASEGAGSGMRRGHLGRTRRQHWALGLTVAASAAALASSAWAGDPGPAASSEPVVGPVPTVLSTDEVRLPVEEYVLSERQVRLLDRARLQHVDECMRRSGFPYLLEQPREVGVGGRNLAYRRYGVTEVAEAAAHGYGVPDAERRPRPRTAALGPDGERVLWGEERTGPDASPGPPSGCVGAAEAALAASSPPATDVYLGDLVSRRAYESSLKDSRVVAVFQRWSGCMAETGLRYPDPMAPFTDRRFGPDGTDGNTTATAVRDVECKRRTNLVGVWSAVESAYQDRLVERHRQALERTRQSIVAHLREAETVLRSGS